MSHFSLNRTSDASVEPVSTAEFKSHARIDISDDDTLIDTYIKAARYQFEEETGSSLITQTWVYYLDKFPNSACDILLPRGPVQSITSIKYVDTDGDEQTWDSSKYDVDTTSVVGRVSPAYSESYPDARDQNNSVYITYKTGYGNSSSSVPADIILAIKTLAAHWYENREAVIVGQTSSEVPLTYKSIRQRYNVYFG